MSDDSETTEPVVNLEGPYQFTVRTFFAAAVWLALFLAAVTTLEETALGTAVALLAWIAFGELYRRFRAVGPLAGLIGGPVFLLAVWIVILIAKPLLPHARYLLPDLSAFPVYAFSWGIALSVWVALVAFIERRLLPRPRARGEVDADSASRGSGEIVASSPFRYGATLFLVHTASALVALALSHLGPGEPSVAAMLLQMALDLPIVPVYIMMIGAFAEAPQNVAKMSLMSLALGGALYAALGFALRSGINRVRNKAARRRAGCLSVDPGPTGTGRGL